MGSIVEAAAQENRREGRREGMAETLIRLLERRFGEVPENVAAQVRAARLEDLEGWLDAVLDAKSLDAIFLNGTAH